MLQNCKKIQFPKISDSRGNLTFIEGLDHIPFDLKRIYYLYDVPGGESRAGHAHKELHQIFISMSGSFDLHLDDGFGKKTFHLNRSYFGVYVCPMIWRDIDNFSTGSTCMVVASEVYKEDDYIRSHETFKALIQNGS